MGKVLELDQVTCTIYSHIHDYLSCDKYNASVQLKEAQTLRMYEAFLDSKYTRAFNVYKILFYKSDTAYGLPVQAFIFQHIRRHCQIFIMYWNKRPYPRVIEVCRLSFGPGQVFFLQLIIVLEHFPTDSRQHFVTFCRFITLP
jgi:hypothetical protein